MKRRQDPGFTIIELLIAVTVSGVILSTLAAAVIVFMQNAYTTTRRDDHTGGAAITATYLDRDLASADTAVANPGSSACTLPVSASQQLILSLTWTEWTASSAQPLPTPAPGRFGVDYRVVDDTEDPRPGRKRLERWYCRGGTTLGSARLVASLAAGEATSAESGTCGAGSRSFVFTLDAFETDASTSSHTYKGCLQGRGR